MLWLRRLDTDKSDEQRQSDVSEEKYFGKDYFRILRQSFFGELFVARRAQVYHRVADDLNLFTQLVD